MAKVNRYSILTDDVAHCYVCGASNGIELHEIYFGSNRNNSIKWGLVVPLCREHHRGTEGVHGSKGAGLNRSLKKTGQEAFQERYPWKDFLEIFGRNYL